MSTVQGYFKCEMCGHSAIFIFNTRKKTYWVFCNFCGYHYKEWYLIDRKHEKKTGEQIYKLTKNKKWVHRFREQIGYGSFCNKTINGFFSLGGIRKPLDEKDIESIRKHIDSPDVDKAGSYLLSFNPTTKELTAVIGKIPEDVELV